MYQWIPAGNFVVDVNFAVDALTAVMLIVVTTIGMLVHVYSIGYMAHDPGRWRFFTYLNFFMFSMLLLVLADNFLVLFVAWELVGLSSYLLIGFWYRRRSAALAAKKAFLVNRVGDLGFSLGIFAVWTVVGTLNFPDVFATLPAAVQSGAIQTWQMTGIALLLFCGAVGKSAQFPLHVWLPDAMEGPTPVSALIHAATMVNAGVYFVARSSTHLRAPCRAPWWWSPRSASSPRSWRRSIALTQTDIKRVLAYSTLSQLGYMFAALGVGAYVAAIFHLVAHGFFKGLLFLDSGSVIHAVHDEQDMNRMGALRRKIPITHWTMLIGALAIAGHPAAGRLLQQGRDPRARASRHGFYGSGRSAWWSPLMTAFYMFRLMGKTFYGPSHVDPEVEPKIHESPRTMTVPLILLAIPSIFIGLLLGLAVRGQPDHAVARSPVFAPGGPHARWAAPDVHAVRHRRSPDPDQRRGRGASAWSPPGTSSASSTSTRARRSCAPGRSAPSRSTPARCTSGTSTTSTTCSSCASAAWSRRRCGGSTGRSSTAPSTASRT